MRALVQRVTEASVAVDGDLVGEIGPGLCAFVGVAPSDDVTVARRLADKIAYLRVMDREKSVLDVVGSVLVVSQFTLYADTSRGRRPSWIGAASPEQAEPLVDAVTARLRDLGLVVATGRFRAHMIVALVNDGPVTLMLEA
jgi:D-tyrosyl-tRNA(Tyr) deacylase